MIGIKVTCFSSKEHIFPFWKNTIILYINKMKKKMQVFPVKNQLVDIAFEVKLTRPETNLFSISKSPPIWERSSRTSVTCLTSCIQSYKLDVEKQKVKISNRAYHERARFCLLIDTASGTVARGQKPAQSGKKSQLKTRTLKFMPITSLKAVRHVTSSNS